jgi:hypothetical protein
MVQIAVAKRQIVTALRGTAYGPPVTSPKHYGGFGVHLCEGSSP